MELKDIYELWNRFDESDTTELELELKGDYVRLKRGDFSGSTCKEERVHREFNKNAAGTDRAYDVAEVASDSEKAFAAAKENDVKEELDMSGATAVKAPLVGTFYQAPSPDEKPFVSVGQKVKKGDVVGIIEAMKLMNEVLAPVDGEVVEYLAKDGSMVEYDQTLLVIK